MTDFLGSAPDNVLNTLASTSFVRPYQAPKVSGGEANPDPYYMRSMARYSAMHQPAHSPMPRGGGGRGGFGQRMNSLVGNDQYPDSPDMDKMNAVLGQFGQQAPHINPFLMFNDQKADGSPSWASNHPRMARGIEGALMGLQVPQGETAGENIANVARTIMGIPQAYKANRAAQFEASFGAARQMGDLQKMIDEHTKTEAEIQHYRALDDFYKRPQKHYDPNAVFQDENKDQFTMDEFSGDFEGIGGSKGKTPKGSLSKVGTPKASGLMPSFVKDAAERAAYNEFTLHGWDFSQGLPGNWNDVVKGYRGSNAAVTGGGSEGGRKRTDYGLGGLSPEQQQVEQSFKEERDKNLQSQTDDNAKMDFIVGGGDLTAWDKEKQSRINKVNSDYRAAQSERFKTNSPTGNVRPPKSASPKSNPYKATSANPYR